MWYAIRCRAAAMTLRTVLLSLQALLASPEPDDPQDAVVARQYKEQRDIFRRTARHWAHIYAGGQCLQINFRTSFTVGLVLCLLVFALFDSFV